MSQIIRPSTNIVIPIQSKMAGLFRFTKRCAKTMAVRHQTAWIPNLITDWGLNARATVGPAIWCHVGTGNTAPVNTDTTLATWLASTNSTLTSANLSANSGSPPYYNFHRQTFRFEAGDAEGNIAEVGIGPAGASTDELFSRALILDGLGDPTTITVLSDEVLDVEYELRNYSPTTDAVFTITDATTDIEHEVTVRASKANVSVVTTFSHARYRALWAGFGSSRNSYTGAIGSVTEIPSGSITVGTPEMANIGYSNNSLERRGIMSWGLSDGNSGAGIRSIYFRSLQLGGFQAEFDPIILKDETKVLTVEIKAGWGRASI